MTKLTIFFVPAVGPAEVREIDNTLKAFQELVGGYMETSKIWAGKDSEYIAVVDEEGKLKGLEPNIYGNRDVLVGPIVITKSNGKDDFASLSKEDIRKVKDRVALGRLALGLQP